MTNYMRQIRSTWQRLIRRGVPAAALPTPTAPESVAGVSQPAQATMPEPGELEYYQQIREPKAQKVMHYTPQIIDTIVAQLRVLDFLVQDLTLDPDAYRAYFAAADYPNRYPHYYAFNLPEKSLEHFVAAQLLDLGPDDVYIDIASEHSPVPEIYSQQFGCVSYRQDLAYSEGMHSDRIGGDAAAMPVPDGFASKMALHCSFEHFEGDSDIRFIREVGRVLRSGGRVCFAPLYLFYEFVNQAGPAAAIKQRVSFDEGAIVYAKLGWRHGFARCYDAQHLASRIRANAGDLDMVIYRVTNAREIDPSCYLKFALLVTKRNMDGQSKQE